MKKDFNFLAMTIIAILEMFALIFVANQRDTIKWNNEFKKEVIISYEQYFDASEELLDSLDAKYDWVDSFDPESYYIAKEKLDSLYRSEL